MAKKPAQTPVCRCYSQEAAAEALGVASGTVRRQIGLGVIRTVETACGLRLVTKDELERYRREHLGRIGRPRKDC